MNKRKGSILITMVMVFVLLCALVHGHTQVVLHEASHARRQLADYRHQAIAMSGLSHVLYKARTFPQEISGTAYVPDGRVEYSLKKKSTCWLVTCKPTMDNYYGRPSKKTFWWEIQFRTDGPIIGAAGSH